MPADGIFFVEKSDCLLDGPHARSTLPNMALHPTIGRGRPLAGERQRVDGRDEDRSLHSGANVN